MESQNWWVTKKLSDLNHQEWESLCDRCGLCCLHKLENEETKDVFYTSVHCALFDTKKCQCQKYNDRFKLVPDCINITIENLPAIANWLPNSCAYKRLYLNQELPSWHPLLNQNEVKFNVKKILRDNLISEKKVNEDSIEDYIIEDSAINFPK